MRILLVDDEESLRITLAANLELEGHHVLEATDGADALEKLRHGDVDLVLSDIRMPGVGGVDLLRSVKQAHPSLPVVLMTAYTAEDQLDAAVLAGVFAVLKKPFDLATALRVIVQAAAGPMVLVVDDDRSVATSLAEALCLAGLNARAVFGGDEALAAMERDRVDVCVTDVVMPDMDGPTLVSKLRERWPKLGVILFSGYDARDVLKRLPNARVDACLRKPVHPRDLLRSIARARGGT